MIDSLGRFEGSVPLTFAPFEAVIVPDRFLNRIISC